jgi:hypothetical protein
VLAEDVPLEEQCNVSSGRLCNTLSTTELGRRKVRSASRLVNWEAEEVGQDVGRTCLMSCSGGRGWKGEALMDIRERRSIQ